MIMENKILPLTPQGRSAALQPDIYPLPSLRKPWFKNRIICDEGWFLVVSGSSWRIDRYDYYEGERHLTHGGDGAAGQMDIFLEDTLTWSEPSRGILDDQTRARVLRNITAALQWAGYRVGFFDLDQTST